MSAAAGRLALPLPAARADPRWVIAFHVARSARRWALVWGAVFGLFVIATVKAYISAYPTLAGRLQIAGSLQSFSILLGQPRHAETVAGFASWRVLVVIAVIGGIWGILTSTGALRGEEDAGRWELLLAGETTKRHAAAQALAGFALALAAMFGLTALLTIAAGGLPGARFPIGLSLLFALAMVSSAAMFLAIGALASQVSATRGQAATIGSGVLGAAFAIRMIADSTTGLGWLRWLSPIGWIEELHPLRDPQPLALVPVALTVAVCGGVTVLLAGRRDLGASVLRERRGSLREPRWLRGPLTLGLRLSRPSIIGWLAAIVGLALVQGLVARGAATLLTSSPAIAATLGRLGVRKVSEAYLGVSFLTVAVLIAVIAASQVAGIRDEEAAGRLDNLLVRPVRRVTWLAGRVGISLSLVVLAGLAAGGFTWFGAALKHTGVDLGTLVEAGVNAIVPAVFVLGAGVLVLGLRPRWSAAVAYGIVAWSFLIDLLGSLLKGAAWLKDSSLFTHMALAPAAKPDWGTAAVVVLLAVVAAIAGAAAFRRRDVEYA